MSRTNKVVPIDADFESPSPSKNISNENNKSINDVEMSQISDVD